MQRIFSDFSIPNKNRLKFFQDRLRSAQGGELYALDGQVSLNASSYETGRCVISKTSARNLRLERSKGIIAQEDASFVSFCFGGAGNVHLAQGGRRATLIPRSLVVYDGEQSLELWSGKNDPYYMLYVPKSQLGSRTHLVENFSAVNFGVNDPVQAVVLDYMQSLLREAEAGADPLTMQLLISQAVGLMLLVIERGSGHLRKTAPSYYKAALLVRIKKYIESNLESPALSISRAAGALGISERNVNLLLNLDGTSFGRYVLSRRLEHCYEDICDSRNLSQHIADISYHWGFVSQAHFSRAFRDRYGISPSEARSRAFSYGGKP